MQVLCVYMSYCELPFSISVLVRWDSQLEEVSMQSLCHTSNNRGLPRGCCGTERAGTGFCATSADTPSVLFACGSSSFEISSPLLRFCCFLLTLSGVGIVAEGFCLLPQKEYRGLLSLFDCCADGRAFLFTPEVPG